MSDPANELDNTEEPTALETAQAGFDNELERMQGKHQKAMDELAAAYEKVDAHNRELRIELQGLRSRRNRMDEELSAENKRLKAQVEVLLSRLPPQEEPS